MASYFLGYISGFKRIRIAANNENFNSQVINSLTTDAFNYGDKHLLSKEKKIESPIPGHPTSDVGSLLVNKLFDSLDVVVKPKSSNT